MALRSLSGLSKKAELKSIKTVRMETIGKLHSIT
jgi:hypothetical protein